MVKKVCVDCLKVFANKSNLNRHTETVHRTPVQPRVDVFDDPTQSDGVFGGDGEISPDLFSDRSCVNADSHLECDDNADKNNSGSEFSDRSDDGSRKKKRKINDDDDDDDDDDD